MHLLDHSFLGGTIFDWITIYCQRLALILPETYSEDSAILDKINCQANQLCKPKFKRELFEKIARLTEIACLHHESLKYPASVIAASAFSTIIKEQGSSLWLII